jgi:hypothetical protein
MAKPKVSDEEKLQTQLLEALRKAIDGTPQRLQGSGKTPGLFPGGQAGAKLIHRARAEGLLQEVPSPEPPATKKSKAKPPVYVAITERGRQLVLDQDSPSKLLAGLRERLDSQGAALAAGMSEVQAQLSAIRETVDQLEKSLATRFAHYQQTAQAFRSILDRLAHQSALVAPVAAVAPGSTTSTGNWLDEVVRFVASQKRLNSFDRPNLKRVYEHLKQTHPTLTLGEFHEGLRTLHQQRRIRLDPFTQALATLQDPLHALYLDREVKYYVDLP